MRFSFVDPAQSAEWDREVREHPGATIFHTTAWAEVIRQTYGHRPFYLRAADESGATRLLLPMFEVSSWLTPRRGVSLPFSDSCEALEADGARKDCSEGVEAFKRIAGERKWRTVEFRGRCGMPADATPSLSYSRHSLDLRPGLAAVRARASSSVRRALGKAHRCELRTRVGGDWEDVAGFVSLHAQTRRRHGAPPQPISFFRNLHRLVIARDLGFVATVLHGNRPVAAAVFLQWGRHAVYKFGASELATQEMRGNNLAMWTGIEMLIARGAETLDFGRSSVAQVGLRRFKASWGAREETLDYFRFATKSAVWVTSKDRSRGAANRLFSRMPLALNRYAGAMIYPHLD